MKNLALAFTYLLVVGTVGSSFASTTALGNAAMANPCLQGIANEAKIAGWELKFSEPSHVLNIKAFDPSHPDFSGMLKFEKSAEGAEVLYVGHFVLPGGRGGDREGYRISQFPLGTQSGPAGEFLAFSDHALMAFEVRNGFTLTATKADMHTLDLQSWDQLAADHMPKSTNLERQGGSSLNVTSIVITPVSQFMVVSYEDGSIDVFKPAEKLVANAPAQLRREAYHFLHHIAPHPWQEVPVKLFADPGSDNVAIYGRSHTRLLMLSAEGDYTQTEANSGFQLTVDGRPWNYPAEASNIRRLPFPLEICGSREGRFIAAAEMARVQDNGTAHSVGGVGIYDLVNPANNTHLRVGTTSAPPAALGCHPYRREVAVASGSTLHLFALNDATHEVSSIDFPGYKVLTAKFSPSGNYLIALLQTPSANGTQQRLIQIPYRELVNPPGQLATH